MEHPQKPPLRHGDLHDPKLPAIRGGPARNRAEQHVCPSPVPQNDVTGIG